MNEPVQVFGANDLVMVPVGDLEPNSWNPQVMSPADESQLEREILEDGFDEPLLVVPHAKKEGKYTIIAGEHRWKVSKKIGIPALPCFVKDAWNDETIQMVKTIRRNVIHGTLDATKFSKLTNKIAKREQVSPPDLADRLGLDEKKFQRVFVEDERKERDAINQVMKSGRADKGMASDVSFVLSEIFDKYGDTAPNGFMFFMHKGEMHLMVRMDEDLSKITGEMVEVFRAQNAEVVGFLKKIIGEGLEVVRKDIEKNLAEFRGDDASLEVGQRKGDGGDSV
jgi:ParB/RepB/Spo0J family partition protein